MQIIHIPAFPACFTMFSSIQPILFNAQMCQCYPRSPVEHSSGWLCWRENTRVLPTWWLSHGQHFLKLKEAQPSWIDACSCFWCCLCCHTTSVFQGMPKGIYRCQELRGRNTVVSPWCCRRQCLPFFTPSFPRKPPGYGSPDTSLSLSPGYKTVSKQPQERRWGLWWCQCSSLDAHSTMNDLRKTVRSMGVSLTSNFQQKYRSLNSRKTEAWGLAAQRTGAKLVEGKPNQTKKASRK